MRLSAADLLHRPPLDPSEVIERAVNGLGTALAASPAQVEEARQAGREAWGEAR
ncbi:MAG: hypothetical protein WCF12_09330 [Propionicimonas sp.]